MRLDAFPRQYWANIRVLMLICMLSAHTLAAGDATASEGKQGAKYGKAVYHRAFMERIKQGPIGILFLGDSITERMTTDGKDFLAKFDAYHPAEFGIGSEETRNLLYRVTTGEVDITPNPAVVVLLIGVNDINHKKSGGADSAATGIKRILEVIRSKLPESKVVLMSILPCGKAPDAPKRKEVVACNKVIQAYADGKNIIYFDLHSKLIGNDGNVPEELMPDALHPSTKGYQIWYDTMWPVVKPILETSR